MSGIYSSLASALQQQGSARGIRKRSNAGPPPILQTLTEPMLWDWSVPSKGSMNAEVYNFCDKIPTNFKSQVYTPGAASFSRNYFSFLQSISDQSSFPLAADLRSALAINNPSPPIYPAAGGVIPKYWTVINYESSVNDVQRAYEVSEYPSSWIAHTAGRSMTQKLDITDVSGGVLMDKEGNTLLSSEAAGVQFGYTAKAWNTITVTVRDWYLGSIVTTVKHNKNKYTTLDHRALFGPNGLIPCRVASFVVALDPQPYVNIEVDTVELSAAVADIGSLVVGGLKFSLEGDANDNLMTSFSNGSLSAGNRQILGTTSTSKNQAYIIAVQLQRI